MTSILHVCSPSLTRTPYHISTIDSIVPSQLYFISWVDHKKRHPMKTSIVVIVITLHGIAAASTRGARHEDRTSLRELLDVIQDPSMCIQSEMPFFGKACLCNHQEWKCPMHWRCLFWCRMWWGISMLSQGCTMCQSTMSSNRSLYQRSMFQSQCVPYGCGLFCRYFP